MKRFLSRLPSWLRAVCVVLVALGTLVRPVMIAGCEIHAARYAHAAQPHVHAHDGTSAETIDPHGLHELMQLDVLAGIADDAHALVVPVLDLDEELIPAPATVPVPDARRAAPFRPPIA